MRTVVSPGLQQRAGQTPSGALRLGQGQAQQLEEPLPCQDGGGVVKNRKQSEGTKGSRKGKCVLKRTPGSIRQGADGPESHAREAVGWVKGREGG